MMRCIAIFGQVLCYLNIKGTMSQECKNYKTLDISDRYVNVFGGGNRCDRNDLVKGWYRFEGGAGGTIATKCPMKDYVCGTDAPGWMKGTHPSQAKGIVTRQVCYHFSDNCCKWNNTILVRNCGEFYVYELDKPPVCNLRYCGNHIGECKNYKTLDISDRYVNVFGGGNRCDRNDLVKGWYRFEGGAGGTIATKCPMKDYVCGTDAPGWMNGTHPSQAQGIITRQVCYHFSDNCCKWNNTIRVRNCGEFYVYELDKPPVCNLRYCGNQIGDITVKTDCPGPSSGRITSPNYPSTYRNNQNCYWLLTSYTGLINLSFQYFSTEGTYDIVRVYNGNSSSSSLIGYFSGRLPNNSIVNGSTTTKMYITFSSDGSITRSGFSLKYSKKGITVQTNCFGTSNTYGHITSPNYPLVYGNNQSCYWLLTSYAGIIGLSFKHFSTQGCCDFVRIFDGNSKSSASIGNFSGNLPNNSAVNDSTATQVYITFHSDGSVRHRGFLLKYSNKGITVQTNCPGTTNSFISSGRITSPNYPSHYRNHQRCYWLITSFAGVIHLSFEHFSTEFCCDKVRIYDHSNSSSHSYIGRFSGNLPNNSAVNGTKSTRVYITFHSDGSGTRRGFSLKYSNMGKTSLVRIMQMTDEGRLVGVSYKMYTSCKHHGLVLQPDQAN